MGDRSKGNGRFIRLAHGRRRRDRRRDRRRTRSGNENTGCTTGLQSYMYISSYNQKNIPLFDNAKDLPKFKIDIFHYFKDETCVINRRLQCK